MGNSDAFSAKINSVGAGVWSYRWGDTSAQSATAIAIDSLGGPVIAGTFDEAINFGGGAFTSAGSKDVFPAKFNAAGNHLWSKAFADLASQDVQAIAIDATGNIVVVGNFNGSINLGGTTLTSPNGSNAFVAKFDKMGNHVWSRAIGPSSATMFQANGLALSPSGGPVVAGSFAGTVDFGSGPIMSTDSSTLDIFVFQTAP